MLQHRIETRGAVCGLHWLAGALAVAATWSMPASAEPSAVDRAAIEAAFARADSNGDGKLSRGESQRFPEIAVRFDVLDADRDGFLSLVEFSVGATPPAQ